MVRLFHAIPICSVLTITDICKWQVSKAQELGTNILNHKRTKGGNQKEKNKHIHNINIFRSKILKIDLHLQY
jgi:hypothetical protein